MLLSGSDVRDPRFMSRMSRTPGMSSTSAYLARMQLLDSAPVRPGWSSDDLFGSLHPSVELRFDPQRVADVVREVFSLQDTPLSLIES
jgi:hypothetical protein